MQPSVTFLELSNELKRLSSAVSVAKQALLHAEAHYSLVGEHTQEQVVRHALRYADPSEGRARVIRETAQTVIQTLRGFSATNTRLVERVSTVLIQADVVVSGLLVKELESVISGRGHVQVAGAIIPALRSLDQMQQRQLLSMARAVVIGRSTENLLGVVTSLVQLHQGRLEQFVGDHLTINMTAVFKAINDLFQDQATDKAFEALADGVLQALKLAGTVVPLLPIVMLGWEIGKKLKEVNEHYTPRNDADDLLEFADQLSVETSAADAAIELSDKLAEALQDQAA